MTRNSRGNSPSRGFGRREFLEHSIEPRCNDLRELPIPIGEPIDQFIGAVRTSVQNVAVMRET